MFTFLFTGAVLLIVGALMIAPFFRCRKNRAFQWYCALLVIFLFLSWIFKLDRYPLLSSILAIPAVLCLLFGWITERPASKS